MSLIEVNNYSATTAILFRASDLRAYTKGAISAWLLAQFQFFHEHPGTELRAGVRLVLYGDLPVFEFRVSSHLRSAYF